VQDVPTKRVDTRMLPFSRPYPARHELRNLRAVLASDHVHGDGPLTRSATSRLRDLTNSPGALLTTSGTHALEMATRLLDIGRGHEVILPSYTFPSAANAVATAGARCVFVDIDPATGNIDPEEVAGAIGPRTRAISVMHYGGQPVDLVAIGAIAAQAGIPIIEDNAHGLGVITPHGVLGTIGAIGIQSFHDTKNVHSGEGGAILLSTPELLERAEIMREKGTDRARFLRGQVDKYSWVDLGSSYLMSELNAAVLDAQLEDFGTIQRRRFAIWDRYATELADWAGEQGIQLMSPPAGLHAAHLFYLLTPDAAGQDALLDHLRAQSIMATFHYVPLDSSTAGRKYGRRLHPLDRSADFSRRLVRLPLWAGLTDDDVTRIIAAVRSYRTATA
jgi:dTDP-4-amino-4,6-dideoxygalactose transaminase